MSSETFELATRFSHIRPQDTPYEDQGLRDFFLYRDLGIAEATGGKVIAQLVKANNAPEQGTGWHRHEAEFHIVIMLKGWARFMYGDKGDAGSYRRLRSSSTGNRALPLRLFRGHGVSGDSRACQLHYHRRKGAMRGSRFHAVAEPATCLKCG